MPDGTRSQNSLQYCASARGSEGHKKVCILWCSVESLRNGPDSLRPALSKKLQPGPILVYPLRDILKPPFTIIASTAPIILRAWRAILLRVLRAHTDGVRVLQDDVCATRVGGEFVVLTIERERDRVVAVEVVNEVVRGLCRVERVSWAVRLVGSVPEEEGFGPFDSVDLFGDCCGVFVGAVNQLGFV